MHSQARDGLIFGSSHGRAIAQTAAHHLFHKVLPECNAPPASNCSPTLACREVSDPCDACGRFGARPPWSMSDRQARLSGRSRGCRLLERSVVNDLWDLLSEPNPLPEIKASVATALTPYIDRPGATAIVDCLLPANWPRHWNWTATRFEDEVIVGNAALFGWTSLFLTTCLYSHASRATDDSEAERIHGRAYIESIVPETSVRHRPPVFVKPSKLPSIRPHPSCDANIDIRRRRPESTGASLG
jgi:hypothetical protein